MSYVSNLYLRDITKKIHFDPDEEYRIFKKINEKKKELKEVEEGDLLRKNQIKQNISGLKNKIIKFHYRLLISIARKYTSNKVPISDLISEGSIALMEAIDFFDDSRNVRFISYAYPIVKQKMINAFLNYNQPIKISKKKMQVLSYFNEIQSKNLMLKGRTLPFQTVSKQMGIDGAKIKEIIARNYSYVSIESRFQDEDDSLNLKNSLISDKKLENEIEDKIDSMNKIIKEIKLMLTPKEFIVLKHYNGLEGAIPITFNKIAKKLNITSERARQIHVRIINKIKNSNIYGSLEEIK